MGIRGIGYKKVDGSFNLTGKVAVVVGGAGGIGEATARMYAKKGAKIAVVDRKDNVAGVAQTIAQEYGTQTIGVLCDVTDMNSVKNAVDTVVERFGEINILANMPGFVELESATDIGMENLEKHMNINAFGVFRVSQLVANQMIKQGKGGKIVCVTSQADFIAINKHVGYTMSKAALVGMIKVCALEWAEFGINVNGVAPTVVNTYMGEKAWQGKVKTDMIEKIPAHRFAETDEIAAAVLFLSCDESNMITGEDLVVDGGFTIY
jgi:glycerol dehydrogenase